MDTDDEPTILRTSTGADFLATLPTLVGRTVTDSLLVIPFHGRRTHGVMRIDLPPADVDPQAVARLSSLALGAMSSIDWCDGVMFAVYTDEAFPVAFAGHRPLIAQLDERFEGAGFQVKDAYCVAADGWASWYESDAPTGGHPPAQIAQSPMAAEAAKARAGAPLRGHNADAGLPTPDPQTAIRLTLAVDQLLVDKVEPNAFGTPVPAALADPIDFVEELLRRDVADTPQSVLARLAVLGQQHTHRDEMTLQIAFGRRVGRRARAENRRWLDMQAETGLSMDEVVRAEFEAAGGPVASPMGELLMGESDTPPRPARIDRAIGILRHTITHLPLDLRPDLLCMLAWLHWAMGSSTAAGAHIDAALSIDAGHGMAQVLSVLVSSGKVPRWIFARYNEVGHAVRTAPTHRRSRGVPA